MSSLQQSAPTIFSAVADVWAGSVMTGHCDNQVVVGATWGGYCRDQSMSHAEMLFFRMPSIVLHYSSPYSGCGE